MQDGAQGVADAIHGQAGVDLRQRSMEQAAADDHGTHRSKNECVWVL